MRKESWDDLRFVLAVAETGSVAAAARDLGVNHATVLRRIAAFETRAGQPVFERTAQGYRLPPDRFALIEAAREVAAAIGGVEVALAGSGEAARSLRITSTDSLCATLLPMIAAELGREGTAVELRATNAHLDLGRLHADIALRPAETLPADLSGEPAGSMAMAGYAANPGVTHWLSLQGALARSRPARILGQTPGLRMIGGADSFLVLREMAAAGLGRTVLPCLLGDPDPRLVRVDGIAPLAVPLWVASHVELAEAPRLKRVRARIVEALAGHAAALEGRA